MNIKPPRPYEPSPQTQAFEGPKKFEVANDLMVHGITLSSRHGYLGEMKQMIAFAEMAKSMGVAKYVKGVFYDSVGSVAELEFHIEPEPCDPVWDAVEEVAVKTLRQCVMPDGHLARRWDRPEPRGPYLVRKSTKRG